MDKLDSNLSINDLDNLYQKKSLSDIYAKYRNEEQMGNFIKQNCQSLKEEISGMLKLLVNERKRLNTWNFKLNEDSNNLQSDSYLITMRDVQKVSE